MVYGAHDRLLLSLLRITQQLFLRDFLLDRRFRLAYLRLLRNSFDSRLRRGHINGSRLFGNRELNRSGFLRGYILKFNGGSGSNRNGFSDRDPNCSGSRYPLFDCSRNNYAYRRRHRRLAQISVERLLIYIPSATHLLSRDFLAADELTHVVAMIPVLSRCTLGRDVPLARYF